MIEGENMSRPFFLFFCSNMPLFAMLMLAIVFCCLVLGKLCEVAFALDFNFGFLLQFIFEPILILSILVTTVVSLVVYVYFLMDLKNRDDIDDKIKKEWKLKFFRMGVLANSLYYEFKYEKNDNSFFLEEFIIKSRDKLLGH
ncbi:MAG: hypothetical protein U9R57_17895 [Thermodesulfobacteriota bacterium]|nr:hypothetical protein [Thermodesulfobacteriota bacterium]